MQLFIKKNPNPQTLIDKVYSTTQPDGYEPATEQAVSDWVHSQIVAGWEPTFPDLPIDEQKAIVEQQRNTYREQSLFLKSQVVSLTFDLATTTQAVTKLEADKAKLTTDLATATTQLETANATIEQLKAEKQALRAEIADLDQALDAEQQLNTTLQAKVADLEQYRPFNPRIRAGEAFYNRVSKQDMVTLLTSDDATLVTVGKTIEAYRAHHWPVVMDSTDFTNLVGYVMQSGVFDEADVLEIMRDATREEAYSA
jgi:cell division protein FtsB